LNIFIGNNPCAYVKGKKESERKSKEKPKRERNTMKTNYKKLAFYSAVVSALTLTLGFATSNKEPEVAYAQTKKETLDMPLKETALGLKELPVFDLPKSEDLLLADAGTPETEVYVPEVNTNPSEPAKFDEPEYRQITAYYLNVRHEPIPTSKIDDVLVKDWIVEAVEIEPDGWVMLKGGGYINGRYTSIVQPEQAIELIKVQNTKEKPKPVFEQPKPKVVAKPVATQPVSRSNNVNTNKNDTQPVSNNGGFSEYEKDLLARLVRAEAQSEPYNGKVAVAEVVLNRINSGKFPSTVEGVIYQRGQFSPVSNGSINKPADSDSRRAVDQAIASSDALYGSLFFYNPDTATSRWLDSKPTTVAIGNHVFKK
jgi:spore germination cell wall hydrolase CwlJ-like protein